MNQKKRQDRKEEVTCAEFIEDIKNKIKYRRGEVLGKGGFEFFFVVS
jgi:hypothetical protein